MNERGEAGRGLAILCAAIVTLVTIVANARSHFDAIVSDPPAREIVAVASSAPRLVAGVAPALDKIRLGSSRAIGAIDEARALSRAELRVRGWIVTPTFDVAPRVVAILDDSNRIDITQFYGHARPDVVASLGKPSALGSGVFASISLVGFSRGVHRVTFASVSADGKALSTLPTSREFRTR